jgi:hypothetical protein
MERVPGSTIFAGPNMSIIKARERNALINYLENPNFLLSYPMNKRGLQSRHDFHDDRKTNRIFSYLSTDFVYVRF